MGSGLRSTVYGARTTQDDRRSLKVFAVLSILYYLFYLAVFASRVGDYWKDVLRHFPWARSWLG